MDELNIKNPEQFCLYIPEHKEVMLLMPINAGTMETVSPASIGLSNSAANPGLMVARTGMSTGFSIFGNLGAKSEDFEGPKQTHPVFKCMTEQLYDLKSNCHDKNPKKVANLEEILLISMKHDESMVMNHS